MNREQMEAWLTLEGWEPVADTRPLDKRGDWYGIRRGMELVVAAREYPGPIKWFSEFEKDFETPGDWADISEKELTGVYQRILEGDPEEYP